jgi:hypothetical protein
VLVRFARSRPVAERPVEHSARKRFGLLRHATYAPRRPDFFDVE